MRRREVEAGRGDDHPRTVRSHRNAARLARSSAARALAGLGRSRSPRSPAAGLGARVRLRFGRHDRVGSVVAEREGGSRPVPGGVRTRGDRVRSASRTRDATRRGRTFARAARGDSRLGAGAGRSGTGPAGGHSRASGGRGRLRPAPSRGCATSAGPSRRAGPCGAGHPCTRRTRDHCGGAARAISRADDRADRTACAGAFAAAPGVPARAKAERASGAADRGAASASYGAVPGAALAAGRHRPPFPIHAGDEWRSAPGRAERGRGHSVRGPH